MTNKRNLYIAAAALVLLLLWRRASAAPAGASAGASSATGGAAGGAGTSGGRGYTYTPAPSFGVGYKMPDFLTQPYGSWAPIGATEQTGTPYQPAPFGVVA